MKSFAIVVAFDSQYGIGKNGSLAWNLPSDLKHFKEITSLVNVQGRQNAIIMGRKTWESLPAKFRPLPGRVNLVLTNQVNLNLPTGVLQAASLDEALNKLSIPGIENIFVIGGAQIYTQAITHLACQKLYVTHVQGNFQCDVFFPPISNRFMLISSTEPTTENNITFHFSDYWLN